MLRPVIEEELPVFRCSSKAETVMGKTKVLQKHVSEFNKSVKIKSSQNQNIYSTKDIEEIKVSCHLSYHP
jgi:hypothetical protein